MIGIAGHIARGSALSLACLIILLAYNEHGGTSYVSGRGRGVPYRCPHCGRVGLARFPKPRCGGIPQAPHESVPMVRAKDDEVIHRDLIIE